MTHEPLDDDAFEGALRAALADLAPATAPNALRAALATVPARRRRRFGVLGGARFAAVGVAASLVLLVVAVAGIGLVAGPGGPSGGPSPAGPTPPASAAPSVETMTFRVVTPDGSPASKAQVDVVGAVMAARLQAYGIGTFSWSATDDRISFDVDVASNAGRDAVRSLLGTTGAFSIGQPVATPLDRGDRVPDPPLLTGEGFTDARVGTDQTGGPTLDLKVDGVPAAELADATRTHVGDYLPIALDGVVIAAPVIRSEIPDGQMQLAFASDDTPTAAWLAAILQAGPLPLPVEAVTP